MAAEKAAKIIVEEIKSPHPDEFWDQVLTTFPHPSKSPTNYGTSPTTFADLIVREQDADVPHEKEYLGYIKYLLGDTNNIYPFFCQIYPNNTNPLELRLTLTGKGKDYYEDKFGFGAQVTSTDDQSHNLLHHLFEMIQKDTCIGVGILLYFERHVNALWITKTDIWRYESQHPAIPVNYKENSINGALQSYFAKVFPQHIFHRHNLGLEQCVQGYRGENRVYKADYFCMDYSLLYIIRRIHGFGHEQAAFDLVRQGEKVLEEIKTLLIDLAVVHRKQIGYVAPK